MRFHLISRPTFEQAREIAAAIKRDYGISITRTADEQRIKLDTPNGLACAITNFAGLARPDLMLHYIIMLDATALQRDRLRYESRLHLAEGPRGLLIASGSVADWLDIARRMQCSELLDFFEDELGKMP